MVMHEGYKAYWHHKAHWGAACSKRGQGTVRGGVRDRVVVDQSVRAFERP